MLTALLAGTTGFAPTPTDSGADPIDELFEHPVTKTLLGATEPGQEDIFEKHRDQLNKAWKKIADHGVESIGLNAEPYNKFIDTSSLKMPPKYRRLEEDPLADGYPIYVDGWNATYVPRKVIDGFASSMVFSFPLAQGGRDGATITADATSVRFPLEVLLQGGYARNVDSTGEQETGATNVMWMQNLDSILTDRAVVAWASKEHTLEHNAAAWDESNLDKILKDRNSLKTQAFWNGLKLFPEKRNKLNMLRDVATGVAGATNWGYEVTDASLDLPHIEQLRAYIEKDDHTAGVAEKLGSERFAKMSADAATAAANAAGLPVVKSEQLCLHLEEAPGLYLNAKEKYFEMPLNKNLVALRGQVSAAPMRVFRVLTGNLVATLSESGNEIQFYMTFSSQSYVPLGAPGTSEGLAPIGLYLGPVDGKTADTTDYPVPATDGRSIAHIAGPSKIRYQLHKVLERIPVDYERWWRDFAKMCPPERVEAMSKLPMFTEKTGETHIDVSGYPMAERLTNAFPEGFDQGLKKANEVMYYLSVGGVLFLNVNCGSNFLRGNPEGGNGYELLEMTVFGHFLFEIPYYIIPVTTSHDWWDEGITPAAGEDCDVSWRPCKKKWDKAVAASTF